MTLMKLAAASCLSLAMATAALAAPVNFKFSFTDGTNTITGLIEGLDSDGIGQEASQITVAGVLATYVFDGPQLVTTNFDVAGSIIDTQSVYVSGNNFGSALNFVSSFTLSGSTSYFILDEIDTVSGFEPGTISGDITFTPASAVPLPAGGLLLLSGLGGVAALKRRKKRAA